MAHNPERNIKPLRGGKNAMPADTGFVLTEYRFET
jgi:hypothetical protein